MKEKILKLILITLTILITLVAVFLMPNLAQLMARSLSDFSFLKKPGLIIIYLSLIPFYICMVQGWRLVDLVYVQEIFSEKAISSFNIIRICSLIIFLIYSLSLIILVLIRVPFTTAYLAISILLLASLAFSLTISLVIRLVKIARDYKEENELTI